MITDARNPNADDQPLGHDAMLKPGADAGMGARRPDHIPLLGWWHVLRRTAISIGKENLGLIAAGCAYFLLLALVPTLTGLIAVYGLFTEPGTIDRHVAIASDLIPAVVMETIRGQIERLIAATDQSLSLTLAGSLLVGLWSSSNGVRTLMRALNIAYGEIEERPLWRQMLGAVQILVLLIAGFILLTIMLAAIPAFLALVDFGAFETVFRLARWPVLFFAVLGFLSVLYRLAPSRRDARWSWITPGAMVATVALVLLTILFDYAAGRLISFNEVYGSLGATIALLLWAYLATFIILIGAEINGQLERQTARDSTTGPERSRGQRGALSADELREKRALRDMMRGEV